MNLFGKVSSICLLIAIVYLNYGHALKCYECTSIGSENDDCDDPFDVDRKPKERECPENEQCVKIKGSIKSGAKVHSEVVIRNCYKTIYAARKAGYRNKSLTHYKLTVDGWIYVCKSDRCNSAIGLGHNQLMITVAALLATFFATILVKVSPMS